MKKYKSQFEEMSINEIQRAVDILYNEYKNKFKTFSELVNFIAGKLNVNKNNVLQILQIMEKELLK